MEQILNTRVNFLLAASAIIAAATTSVIEKHQDQAAFAFACGACLAGLMLVGIDRSCAKLNFYLSWLHRSGCDVETSFARQAIGKPGLSGSVFVCTYGIPTFILVVFFWLALHVQHLGKPG